MAGGVQMGPCQVIAGSQCGFLLADGASALDALSEVQEPIDVKWVFCLLVPFLWTWVDVLTATGLSHTTGRGTLRILRRYFFMGDF
ncbi:hypothetical protein PEX1_034240 [Penicillium expansum]|uniref:Uncharacterized protein n=1 Tax=Penicillium expansum TaxID=27334 RepID=A0A0A2JRN9_PENEN|nr:hypothetical protein PEX2_019550 [Penicillium expansum]KGO37322.1 hypothetical protein PEXP_003300 [Penicillium expansum]KGO57511.1 hypothetical protein PEX2_019550 [Penicillium expansum]KGO68700.1 hypothetical protein PEX1_034240 [Penicillium expansum]